MQNGSARLRAAANLAAALFLCILAGCADPLIQGGSLHFDAGRFEQAAGVFEQAVAKNPNDSEAHLWLARSYSELGRPEDAVREYDKALALNPSLRNTIAGHRQRYWRAQLTLGDNLVTEAQALKAGSQKNDRLKRAAAALETAAAYSPQKALTDFQESRLHAARGEDDLARQALDRAFQKAESDREAVPVLLPLVREEGRKAVIANRYADAVTQYERARRLAPEDPDLLLDLASAYLLRAEEARGGEGRNEDYRQAAGILERLRRIRGSDADVIFNLATVRYRLGQYASADSLLRAYLSLKPRDPDGYDLLHEVAQGLGNDGEARVADLAARALDAKSPVASPGDRARSAAVSFGAGSALARFHAENGAPEEIHALKEKGGPLEVWFYFGRGLVAAFENGASAGTPLRFRR